MTLEKVPFGGQLVQCMYDACGVKMQVGDDLICGERTMGFRVTGHSPGHVIGGKFVPESPLLQLLLNFSDHIRIEHLAMSVVPSNRSSICESRDSSCVLRSA